MLERNYCPSRIIVETINFNSIECCSLIVFLGEFMSLCKRTEKSLKKNHQDVQTEEMKEEGRFFSCVIFFIEISFLWAPLECWFYGLETLFSLVSISTAQFLAYYWFSWFIDLPFLSNVPGDWSLTWLTLFFLALSITSIACNSIYESSVMTSCSCLICRQRVWWKINRQDFT